MESFASYAFNKSHAAAYAVLSYQTAWLKCHYPQEYMAALLTSVLDNTDKVAIYTTECMRLGIRVLPPHVNNSGTGFTVVGKDIRFGLLAIKNLGRGLIQNLEQEREANGVFSSYYQFCKRMHPLEMNRRALESLIKSGALDGLEDHYNRRQMLSAVGEIIDHLDADKRKNLDGQIGFFDIPDDPGKKQEFFIAPQPELSPSDKLAMEKETTGMYLSGHPMADYASWYDRLGAQKIGVILDDFREHEGNFHDDDSVTLLGILTSVKLKATRSNAMMAFLVIEDIWGSMEVLVFPQTLSSCSHLIAEGRVVQLVGRLSLSEEKAPKLICESVFPAPQDLEESDYHHPQAKKASRPGLYVKVPAKGEWEHQKAMQYLAIFDGATPLYLYFQDTKKLLQAPPELRVDVNEPLLNALKKLLGDENVVVVS